MTEGNFTKEIQDRAQVERTTVGQAAEKEVDETVREAEKRSGILNRIWRGFNREKKPIVRREMTQGGLPEKSDSEAQ